MKLFAIAATSLLLTASTAAQARQWWMVNAQDGRCTTAAELARDNINPDTFAGYLRSQGTAPHIDIIRDDSGDVRFVLLSVKDGSWVFATSAEACHLFVVEGFKDGSIVSRNDLR